MGETRPSRWLVFKSLAWETRPFGDGSVECSADGRSCCDVIMARSVTFDVFVVGLWCAKRRCEEALRTSICYANVSFVALGVAHALDHWRVRLSRTCPFGHVRRSLVQTPADLWAAERTRGTRARSRGTRRFGQPLGAASQALRQAQPLRLAQRHAHDRS